VLAALIIQCQRIFILLIITHYRRFRRGFAQFFFWCPWVRVSTEPSLSRSEAVTSRYSCTGSPDMHTRISRNGTSSCIPSEYTCTTASTTPRSASQFHLEHLDTAQGDAHTSSIDLHHLAPDTIIDGDIVASRDYTLCWQRDIPYKAYDSKYKNQFNEFQHVILHLFNTILTLNNLYLNIEFLFFNIKSIILLTQYKDTTRY